MNTYLALAAAATIMPGVHHIQPPHRAQPRIDPSCQQIARGQIPSNRDFYYLSPAQRRSICSPTRKHRTAR